jgi:undecaprenyl-diphosphatase
MALLYVIVLAIVQGLTELLPVSSSAHVVVAEKLMGMDPSSPETTLLLVMLHTGTMFAVILYFWQQWREAFFKSVPAFKRFTLLVVLATGITGAVGGTLIKIIEGVFFQNAAKAEIEQLFGRLELIAPALGVVGVLILIAGLAEKRSPLRTSSEGADLGLKQAGWIGAVQGFCLPFRGFSRSGATISAGVLAGVSKARSEEFSFALAVVLTPPAIMREILRLMEAQRMSGSSGLGSAMLLSLVGGLCAFLAGLLALKWLSRWLQTGRWYLFGIYCLIAAAAAAVLHRCGY